MVDFSPTFRKFEDWNRPETHPNGGYWDNIEPDDPFEELARDIAWGDD